MIPERAGSFNVVLLQYFISDDDTLRTCWMLVFESLCAWSWVALVTMTRRNPHKLAVPGCWMLQHNSVLVVS